MLLVPLLHQFLKRPSSVVVVRARVVSVSWRLDSWMGNRLDFRIKSDWKLSNVSKLA